MSNNHGRHPDDAKGSRTEWWTNQFGSWRDGIPSSVPSEACRTQCCECEATVHPTLTEHGDIRCSSCRAKHIISVISARCAAAE